jgi:hypothetical protein
MSNDSALFMDALIHAAQEQEREDADMQQPPVILAGISMPLLPHEAFSEDVPPLGPIPTQNK